MTLVSFDDSKLHFGPYIDQNISAIAEKAVKMIIQQVNPELTGEPFKSMIYQQTIQHLEQVDPERQDQMGKTGEKLSRQPTLLQVESQLYFRMNKIFKDF